jgi:hypothetical protein
MIVLIHDLMVAEECAGRRRARARGRAKDVKQRGTEMTDKSRLVQLSPEMVARCQDYARNMVEHYRNNGDRITAMPWTRDQLSDDELRAWLASREEAGRAIDIETCERGGWKACDDDPYGIREMLGEQVYPQFGTNHFVRSPESRGWVWEGDLPHEKGCALYKRIEHQRAALTSNQAEGGDDEAP